MSTLKQGEKGSSLQEQRTAIEAYARRSGIEIVQCFEEMETAAKRGRPMFNKLVSLLRKRRDIGVIIHKIDRSARNLKDWSDLGELIDGGVEVHFAHESLDLKSRGGRLAADIQAVVAADFIRNLRDEVRKGIQGRLNQGLFPNKAPLGYLDTGKGQVKTLDPARAPLVRKAFELYAEGGFNLEQLRDKLYELGLRNFVGGKLHKSGLSGLLNNPFYTGRILVRRTGESYAGIHTPLISVALFEKVQDRLSGRKKNKGLRRKYLYQKILRCHSCSGILVPELQKSRYVYYRCHTRGCTTRCVREELITAQLVAQLSSLQVRQEDIHFLSRWIESRASSNSEHLNARSKIVRLELGRLDDRLMKLTDLVLDGAIDNGTFNAKRAELLDEKFRRQEELNALLNGKDKRLENAQHLLDCLKLLHEQVFLPAGPNIAVFSQLVISNFSVFQKQLVPHWGFPMSELIQDDLVLNGARERT